MFSRAIHLINFKLNGKHLSSRSQTHKDQHKCVEMLHLDLGNGRRLPALGLGTWQATDENLEIALEAGLEAGYRHFDTAILYDNERTIGKVLNRWLASGKVGREELFVTTKLPPMGLYPEKVEGYLKKSLANLQLDYADLYLIHSPEGIKDVPGGEVDDDFTMDGNVDHVAVWKELEKLVDSGLVKSIGVSNFSALQIDNILKNCRLKPANLQVELHVYCQQKELVGFCREHGITVVAYSPLGSPGLNDFYRAYGKTKDVPNLMENDVVKRIAAKHDKTAAQILLRHIVQRGLGAVPKSTNLTRLRENICVFDFALDQEDMDNLDGLDLGNVGRVTDWESWTWI